MKALNVLNDGFRFKIGSGITNIWYVSWLNKDPLCNQLPFVDIHDVNLRICDIHNTDSWQLNCVYTLIPPDMRIIFCPILFG